MKQKLTVVLWAVLSTLGVAAKGDVPELKKAILMTYYGTLDDSARMASFDVMTQKVRQAFPGVEVREAYTSRATAAAMRRKSGKPHLRVHEAMMRLENDGYNSIIAVSGEILYGKTEQNIRHCLDTLRHRFFEIKTTTPLLYTADDCRKAMQVILDNVNVSDDEQVVFVAHGKNGAADDVFCLCDYILQHEGHSNCHVATVEGYPSLENIKQILRNSGTRKVVLAPLMMTGGGHAKRFVCTTWRKALEAEGYMVRTVQAGVLEYSGIQQIIIDKIRLADQQP